MGNKLAPIIQFELNIMEENCEDKTVGVVLV